MPAISARITKTYLAVSKPNTTTGEAPKAVISQNPQRIALFVQNTGAKPGLLRIGGPCQVNGSDIALAAGAWKEWDQADTCPQESVNVLASVAADTTTWSIMETVVPI